VSYRHCFGILLTLAVSAVPVAAQSSWDRYKPGSVGAIIAQEREGVLTQFKLGRGHHTVISGASFPTRTTVEFLDSSRATPSERIAVLEAWTKSLHVNVDVRSALTTELLFREDSLLLWLPVQEVLVPSFRNELKRGDLVTLFLGYVGAEGQGSVIDWVFIVNEFEK